MHIWVDFSHLPLKKRGKHITWPLIVEVEAYHLIFPSHWDCEQEWPVLDGELDSEEEVCWTQHQSDWLSLGLRADWHRLFQTVWPGDGPRAGDSFLTSSVPSLISGPSPSHWPQSFTAVNYHLSHLGENPFLLGWGGKRKNLNLEVFLWLLLHQERMPHKTSDLFFFFFKWPYLWANSINSSTFKKRGRTICEYKWSNKFHS